jgi:hypothetical protein
MTIGWAAETARISSSASRSGRGHVDDDEVWLGVLDGYAEIGTFRHAQDLRKSGFGQLLLQRPSAVSVCIDEQNFESHRPYSFSKPLSAQLATASAFASRLW